MLVTKRATHDMVGERFNRLVVLELSYKKRVGRGFHRYWKCRCDCGQITIKDGIYLRTGDTKSCGCLKSDSMAEANMVHGLARIHRLYSTWKNMRTRCLNPTCPGFKNYGGRGITICERWNDFSLFVEDMWPTWKEGLSLNRIDNDGPYCPDNCEWATYQEQANNKRRNHWIVANGKNQTIAQWAREIGCFTQVISKRIERGWSGERSVTEPIHRT